MADDLILMKLGGSVITNKKSQTPKCRKKNITRIAETISKSNKKIIIVHGAGSYAHPLAKKYKIGNGLDGTDEQLEAIAKAKKQMRELNQLLCKSIAEVGLDCESIIPSKSMMINRENEVIDFPKRKFDEIISMGKIATTFGDVVNTKENNVGILSGDTLLLKLAELYKPKRTFFVMDYPGVVKGSLDAGEIEIHNKINSKFVNEVSIHNEGDRPDVTGGLLNKIKCALQISNYSECWISGLDNLDDCVNGIPKGTRVTND